MAIRIGTTGEEPPPLSFEDAGSTGWLVCCTGVAGVPAEPFSGLPCPVPPSLPVVAAPPVVEDGLPFAPEDPEFAVVEVFESGEEAPPFTLDDLAGASWWVGGFPP